MARRLLLICGVLSSLVYAGSDIVGGTRWEHYSWPSQEFSRLSAIGAPSRPLHLVLTPIYTLLVIAFGYGVWRSAGHKRSLRVIGVTLVIYAIGNWIWPQFYPEDLSQPASALTNTMHIILTMVTVLTWLFILVCAATAYKNWLRFYSLGTLLAVIGFGALAGSQGPALAAGLPTPWLGLVERVNI